jgi:hypothetical protein
MSSPLAELIHANIRSYEAEQTKLKVEIAKLECNPKMAGEIAIRRSQQKMLQDNIDSLVVELRKLTAG